MERRPNRLPFDDASRSELLAFGRAAAVLPRRARRPEVVALVVDDAGAFSFAEDLDGGIVLLPSVTRTGV